MVMRGFIRGDGGARVVVRRGGDGDALANGEGGGEGGDADAV